MLFWRPRIYLVWTLTLLSLRSLLKRDLNLEKRMKERRKTNM